MLDEGVIKFNFAQFEKIAPLDPQEIEDVDKARSALFDLNLIGEYLPEKIGFGNISLKKDYRSLKETNNPQFIISGTQTGAKARLEGQDYTRVLDFSLDDQSVWCQGPVKASSESLTHAAIYLCDSKINAVIHIHNRIIWDEMQREGYPATAKDTSYGTKEMALEVEGLIKSRGASEIVMSGHEDGVLIFAQTMEEALKRTLELHAKFLK